jgi:alpha-glucosidase
MIGIKVNIMSCCVACFMAIFITSTVTAQKNIRISSPEGKIKFEFSLQATGPFYSVSFKGRPLITNSELGLEFDQGVFRNLKVLKPVFKKGEEKYELIVGKTSKVEERYEEVTIPLQENAAPFRMLNLIVRIFNDGVAFRYEFPKQDKWLSYTLTDERTSFKIDGDPKVLALQLPGYTTSHEGEYSSALLSQIKEDTLLIDLPVLFEFPENTFMAITEASLVNYAGMYLGKRNGVLTSLLSPSPKNSKVKVQAQLPHKTPWRVLMISDRVGALIESNILTSLSEPSKIKDDSWIKTGKATWPWWNGNVISDSMKIERGNNFETNKYFIDFCARNGIEFHSVVEYGEHEWYVNDGSNFQPGPNADVTKPVPGLDMQKVCDYAKEKGVGIRFWVHFGALYPKLDEAFAQYEKWGIKGLMVDFMDRDDQEMIIMQEEILQKAAKHKLHIQFHGVQKPTGLHRTYPNEFTREGVMNYEYDKWGKVDPDHDVKVPFTRMLAGPTDYHLGGFRAVPDSLFNTQYKRPVVLGTRCHMLAMYVVLESYLGLVCDYPSAYEGQRGFDFLKKVPTTWDETKVLDAKVGEYIVIARRKNNDWFVGTITDHHKRKLTIDFGFLPEGDYEMELHTDTEDASTNPNNVSITSKKITRNDKLSIELASGGGAVMHLKKRVAGY